ncbi:MAG: sn-glycerol-3-phosphate ABC transporter ATP-binding protein UgpC [Rhodothermales bacterium]|nr:sn-glycerol-3-phosphate ABC transporter ATP-binding protein UgpC [Rhodothermales bacterium]
MARVKATALKKVYENGFVAVHGADFVVEDGEFVVLVGPSGCGKSTTLRMVAGLESITSGDLQIGESRVNEVPPKDRDIAMVFQNYALYPHMTVFDNMAFGLKLRKYSRDEIDQRVRQAAEILGIESILDRKPGQLSGGQRQRVAVGRAIVRKPQVFLFDEPLSNLDAKLRVQMRTEISKLHRQLGATMIYVTHDQVEAMTMGDRIVVMKDGHIQQIDSPLNLYDHPVNRFVAGFIGSPSMNFLSGHVSSADSGPLFSAAGESLTVALKDAGRWNLDEGPGRGVTLGIRPEDIYVAGSPYAPGPTSECEFTLEVVEPMGNEIFVYARNDGQQIVARVAPQSLPQPGESISLAFDTSKLHFFDAETEVSLSETDRQAA